MLRRNTDDYVKLDSLGRALPTLAGLCCAVLSRMLPCQVQSCLKPRRLVDRTHTDSAHQRREDETEVERGRGEPRGACRRNGNRHVCVSFGVLDERQR
eukprot:6188478-Pleurochrysis_carterae.AAC.1